MSKFKHGDIVRLNLDRMDLIEDDSFPLDEEITYKIEEISPEDRHRVDKEYNYVVEAPWGWVDTITYGNRGMWYIKEDAFELADLVVIGGE